MKRISERRNYTTERGIRENLQKLMRTPGIGGIDKSKRLNWRSSRRKLAETEELEGELKETDEEKEPMSLRRRTRGTNEKYESRKI
ncbi:hypothetical protein HPP92_002567 [Vanilla planifolia]|uniref:Uncharacterized protein n=1 Tax=Vanilla planifolia TaxID=51239 RepID=A0A835VIM0_VANPL|nr:hypothetical protein HPP92_002567 [Vanilla planifolia]